jgi:hypothetical protein
MRTSPRSFARRDHAGDELGGAAFELIGEEELPQWNRLEGEGKTGVLTVELKEGSVGA